MRDAESRSPLSWLQLKDESDCNLGTASYGPPLGSWGKAKCQAFLFRLTVVSLGVRTSESRDQYRDFTEDRQHGPSETGPNRRGQTTARKKNLMLTNG